MIKKFSNRISIFMFVLNERFNISVNDISRVFDTDNYTIEYNLNCIKKYLFSNDISNFIDDMDYIDEITEIDKENKTIKFKIDEITNFKNIKITF